MMILEGYKSIFKILLIFFSYKTSCTRGEYIKTLTKVIALFITVNIVYSTFYKIKIEATRKKWQVSGWSAWM